MGADIGIPIDELKIQRQREALWDFVQSNSEKIWEHYSKYGIVNGVGANVEGIVIYFESMTSSNVPTEYEGYKAFPFEIGIVTPAGGVNE